MQRQKCIFPVGLLTLWFLLIFWLRILIGLAEKQPIGASNGTDQGQLKQEGIFPGHGNRLHKLHESGLEFTVPA
jgi:hypothetical protein